MAKVAICIAIAIMYTVLLTRLGSNSLYRSTNCSCLQDVWNQDPSVAPAAPEHSQGSAWLWLPQDDFCNVSSYHLLSPTKVMLPLLGAPYIHRWDSTHFSGLRAWASLYR